MQKDGPLQRHPTSSSHREEPLPWFSPWINVLFCWKHQGPSHLGNMLSPGICSKTSHQDGWVTSCPWVSGNPSPLGSYFLAASWTCWNTMPEIEQATWRKRSRCGSWSGISHHPAHLLPPDSAASLSPMYVQLGPKVANLLLLKARWARSIFLWVYHLAAVFVPSTGLEDNRVHIKVLTKFTQQALNDSQKSLSLSNIEMSLTRKAVP